MESAGLHSWSTSFSFLYNDISLVISSCNKKQYENDVNGYFAYLNDWFNSNLLTLNINKTKHVQFEAKSSFNYSLIIKIME
jgi:hypothetical protein